MMIVHRLYTHTVIPWVLAGVLTAALLPASRVGAQGRPGSATFAIYCASCHGASAKGDGPLASEMKIRPADLTQIAKRNGGSFPTDQVTRAIDGRSSVKSHGGKNMPVWGDVFAKSTADTTPADQTIQRLVSYLESIQGKP